MTLVFEISFFEAKHYDCEEVLKSCLGRIELNIREKDTEPGAGCGGSSRPEPVGRRQAWPAESPGNFCAFFNVGHPRQLAHIAIHNPQQLSSRDCIPPTAAWRLLGADCLLLTAFREHLELPKRSQSRCPHLLVQR